MTGFNALHTLNRAFQELICNTFLYQCTGRAGTDFTLIQGKHGKAFQCLIQIVIFLIHNVGKEQVWGFAAQLEGHRNNVFGGILHDQLTHCGRTGKGNLGNTRVGRKRTAHLNPVAIDDIQHARWQNVLNQFSQHQNTDRSLFRRFQHNAVTRSQGRCQFPGSHQNREVPRDNLTHDAQRLM